MRQLLIQSIRRSVKNLNPPVCTYIVRASEVIYMRSAGQQQLLQCSFSTSAQLIPGIGRGKTSTGLVSSFIHASLKTINIYFFVSVLY